MKDTSTGEKIRAKTMTQEQAVQVLERLVQKAKRKTHRRALEFALEEMSTFVKRVAKAAKA